MEHWIAVFRDIWILAKWVVPPGLFLLVGGCMGEGVGEAVPIFFFLAYIAYAAALSGWWS